jgi:hypothetical protein
LGLPAPRGNFPAQSFEKSTFYPVTTASKFALLRGDRRRRRHRDVDGESVIDPSQDTVYAFTVAEIETQIEDPSIELHAM